MERLLSVDEVGEFLGTPVATQYQWRHKGAVGGDRGNGEIAAGLLAHQATSS